MKTLLVGTLIILIGLGGCASSSKTSKDEMMAAATRTYEGVSSQQVIQAAEKLLKLVDESRFKFDREDHKLTATRSGQLFTALGATDVTAVWLVSTQEKDKATVVTIEAGWQKSLPSSGKREMLKRPEGTAVYNLFYNRLDTMLGRSNEWITCKGMKQAIKQGEASGDIRMLCAYSDDKLPESQPGKK